jgi:hypothetical protein
MCRYAFHKYKDHMACFRCRKTFKRWLWKARKESSWQPVRRLELHERKVLCPQCAQLMANMGLDFRAPKQTEVGEWEVLAILYERGFAFRGCGCDAGRYIPPKRVREIPAFLEAHHPGARLPKKRQGIAKGVRSLFQLAARKRGRG